MQRIEASAGSHITNAVVRLCEQANRVGASCIMKFNGADVVAAPGEAPATVEARWQTAQAEADAAYRASPEGIAAAAAARQSLINAQAIYDRLMSELPAMDWSDDIAVLDWLSAVPDHIGVKTSSSDIINAFTAAGFHAGVNCGDDYRDEDRDNVFRYLVGQCLEGIIIVGSPHPVMQTFVKRFKQRFAA